MITLIDRYGFVKQLNVTLPPGSYTYKMACFTKNWSWVESNAAYATSFETREFVRQGNTNVYEER